MLTARSWYNSPPPDEFYAGEKPWRFDQEVMGGGAALDTGPHWLRPLRMVLGEIDEVVATTQRTWPQMDGESLVRSLCRFRSGVVASFDVMLATGPAAPMPYFQFIGTSGEVLVTADGEVRLFDGTDPSGTVVGRGGLRTSLEGLWLDFEAAVLDGTPLAATAEYSLGEVRACARHRQECREPLLGTGVVTCGGDRVAVMCGGDPAMNIDVTDNQAASRYEIAVDGTVIGFADYRRSDGRVVFPHTVITPSMREQGMAEILVRHALDAARRDGHVVVPVCWYVAQFIDEHPEYADLLEPADPPTRQPDPPPTRHRRVSRHKGTRCPLRGRLTPQRWKTAGWGCRWVKSVASGGTGVTGALVLFICP